MSMFIEAGTKMEEIYQRAARWVGVDPIVIELSRRIVPEGNKIKNIDPETVARNDVNLITYLRMRIRKVQKNNVSRNIFAEDDDYMAVVQIDEKRFKINKNMKIKSFKSLIVRNDGAA
jgi:hypothetical protein